MYIELFGRGASVRTVRKTSQLHILVVSKGMYFAIVAWYTAYADSLFPAVIKIASKRSLTATIPFILTHIPTWLTKP